MTSDSRPMVWPLRARRRRGCAEYEVVSGEGLDGERPDVRLVSGPAGGAEPVEGLDLGVAAGGQLVDPPGYRPKGRVGGDDEKGADDRLDDVAGAGRPQGFNHPQASRQ
jgi:hypothetical protein